MKITVAINTWNRAALLDRTLGSLHRLRIPPGVSWELLVVNNNSTDATADVIKSHAGSLPLRHLFEPQQGVSFAKNRGVREATGDLMLWTDDDVVVDERWMEAYHEAALAWPEATYFGGTIEPLYESEPPRWVVDNLDLLVGPLALCSLGETPRPVADGESPVGANMAFRREVLGEVVFNTVLGRKGAGQIRGEELEVFQRLAARGHTGVWVPDAKLLHHIPTNRMTAQYVAEWFYWGGVGDVRYQGGVAGTTILGYPRWVVRRYLKSLVVSWLTALGPTRAWLRARREVAYQRGTLAALRELNRSSRIECPVTPQATAPRQLEESRK